jgi:hypothetical protein
MKKCRGEYGISALELHDDIIEDMVRVSKHFSLELEDILEGHNRRPLKQTIEMCLISLRNEKCIMNPNT